MSEIRVQRAGSAVLLGLAALMLSACVTLDDRRLAPFWSSGDWGDEGELPRAAALLPPEDLSDDPLAAYLQLQDWRTPDSGIGGFGLQQAIGDELRYLPIINSSSTDVACLYRGGYGQTFEVVIPRGARGKLYPAAPIGSDLLGAQQMDRWLAGMKLSCPAVAGGKIYRGLRRGNRYVIQRAADGGLELVVVIG